MFSSMLPPTPVHHTFNLNHTYQFSPVVSSPLSSSPLRSSPPLSPRDANVNAQSQGYDFGFRQSNEKTMSSPTPQSKTSNPQINLQSNSTHPITLPSPPPSRGPKEKKESTFSKRASKPNPLLHSHRNGDDGRETRRKLFLKKVRDGAEEKRWKDRGGDEEIMRVLWMGEERERRRKVEMAIAMQTGVVGVSEEEGLDFDEMMAEEVAMIEQAELEARFEDALPRESKGSNWVNEHQSRMDQDKETDFGSDDDEYDHIFMDVAKAEGGNSNQQPHQPEYLQLDQDHEMMDMS